MIIYFLYGIIFIVIIGWCVWKAKKLLDIYYLLVHRIEGLGWSLSDFWEADNYTTSYLYCRELDLIEYEKEQYSDKDKNKPKGIRGEQSEIESDEFNKLLKEYAEID